MKSFSIYVSRAALGVLLAGASVTAVMAATTTSTFQVTANVLASCQVSATNLSFGNYSGSVIDGTSTLSVTCTQNQGYDVGLNGGSTSQPVSARKMSGPGGAQLSYSLYSDTNRTTNWGNTVGTDAVHGNGSGSAQTLTVYGRLPASQQVSAGAYTDTITATITY